jgi:hypothetical protein
MPGKRGGITMRKLLASLCVTGLLAVGVVSTASAQQTQIGDGLVVLNIAVDDTLNNNNVNVVVPIQAAVPIAANVCGVNVTVAVLAAVDQGGLFDPVECTARSRAHNGGTLTITN